MVDIDDSRIAENIWLTAVGQPILDARGRNRPEMMQSSIMQPMCRLVIRSFPVHAFNYKIVQFSFRRSFLFRAKSSMFWF